jgi:tripartite-type tricarboxylate transporter receptor subunit TctC
MTPVPYENSFIYPDLPTGQEEGLPAFDVEVWLGLYGPAGMPADVITALNSAVTKALQVDALKTAFAKFGIEPRGTSTEQGADFTKHEYEKWKKIIEHNRITLD